MSPRLLTSVIAAGVLLGAASGTATVATGATTPETSPAQVTTPANPGPPKVTAAGAEAISRTGATVNANIAAGAAGATYYFEYGTSSGYGLRTPDESLPAGDAPVTVKRALTGLTVETTYHYRVVATNPAGTVRGSDRTFRTTANPKAPSVSTQAPINVAAQSAAFVARVNPQGQETTFVFQYGTTSKLGQTTPAVSAGAGTSTVTVNTPVAPLNANTRYYFRVVAKNATGSRNGSIRNFTTPRGLTGVAAAASPSTVVWSAGTTIAGTVAGAGVGGVSVALLKQDFPYTGAFTQLATQTVSSAGAFSVAVPPLFQSARFQVATRTNPALSSSVVQVDGALFTKYRVSKRKAKSVELTGLIYPAANSARVSIERKTPKGRWIRVKRIGVKALTNRSKFSTTVPRISRKATYRAVISPRDGGAHVSTKTKTLTVAKRR